MLGLNATGAPGPSIDFCPDDWRDLSCEEFHAIKCDYSSPIRNPRAPEQAPAVIKPTGNDM